ncbi:hypothetical protein U9M48_040594, partial [Paspalum notatum var. saurae]
MAWRYIKMGMCGTSAANHREEEQLQATAAVVAIGLGKKRRWGGSVYGHAVKNRKREEVNEEIMRNYFNDPPLFDDEYFRRRFRMRKSLFLRIVQDVTARNKYFKQKRNAANKLGFTPIHKCLVAMRMLAYGGIADALDDTYMMSESTVLKTLKEFANTVIAVYEKEYLRPPRPHELQTILKQNEARGFPGMIGSIDCMHWEWENCPTAWAGVCKATQESCRKDVERAFGVLQSKFKIIHNPCRLWKHRDINAIMRACVILHNMIIEDERNIYVNPADNQGFDGPEDPPVLTNRDVPEIGQLIDAYNCIKSKETSGQLQRDLIEHIWRDEMNEQLAKT